MLVDSCVVHAHVCCMCNFRRDDPKRVTGLEMILKRMMVLTTELE